MVSECERRQVAHFDLLRKVLRGKNANQIVQLYYRLVPGLGTLAQGTRLGALRHRGLLTVGITALLYNYGFFTLLAYTPFPLDMGMYSIGFIFFGWGLCLAIASVFVAPKLQRAFGTLHMMMLALLLFALDLAAMAMFTENKIVLIVGTVVAGLFAERPRRATVGQTSSILQTSFCL